jgi:hypothetical protein
MRSLWLMFSRRWLLVFVLLTTGLYFYESGRLYSIWSGPDPGGYTSGYAKALTHGHLYLKKAPPEMEKLADPYDPAQYAPYYTFDLSYYRGAIYSYFGVAPPLLLYVPWTTLTGSYLSEQFGVGLFMSLGFAVSVALLAALRKRYLPDAPEWALFLSVLVLALGTNTLILFWPPYYSQVVQSCARLLQISALAGCYLALQSQSRAKIWLAFASFCTGLMVVARPSFVPAIFLLVPPWWVVTRRALAANDAPRRAWLGVFFAALLPLSAVGLGQMWLNWARFDSPLEFGMTYQQFGQDLRELVWMSPEYLVKNVTQSLFYIPTFTHYFPFMLYQSEPIGALTMLPFSWLLVFLFFGWRAQAKGTSGFGAMAMALVIAPVGNFIMLSCYCVAWARYDVDVVFPESFAAAVGLVAGAHVWRTNPWRRRSLAVVAVALVAVNLWTSVCFSFTYPIQPQIPWVTNLFNAPVYFWEKLSGAEFSDTRSFDVTFPTDRIGASDALMTTGTKQTDTCYVRYVDASHVTLSVFHNELGAIETDPIAIAPGSSHRLQITLGSLCPPAGHPVFTGWSRDAVERAHRQLRVALDGQVVLDQEIRFHPSSPSDVKVAGWLKPGAAPKLAARPSRLPTWPAGGIDLTLQFNNRRAERYDPVFSIGSREAGDLLFVVYTDATHLQLGWDHGLATHTVSQPIVAPDDGAVHRVSIEVLPAGATDKNGRTVVRFDGAVVLEIPTAPFAASNETACFGVQSFPAPTEPIFGGRILSVQPRPASPSPSP